MSPRTIGPYGRLARISLTWPRQVFAVAALLTILGTVLGLPPEVDGNLIMLLPEDDPYATSLRQMHDESGGAAFVTLTFEGDDPEKMGAVLDELVEELETKETVSFALHRLDEELAFRVGLLQLEPQELDELNLRLQAALAMGPALNPMMAQRLLDMGPITDRIARAHEVSMFGGGNGNRARVVVRPNGSNLDPDFAELVMVDIEDAISKADLEGSGVTLVWRGGAYHNVADDLRGIRSDLLWTSVASALLVLLVLVVSFRSWRVLVLVFPPLVVANLINLGLTWMLIGSLNTYTSFATAILIGLGIDFAVHLVTRYREERSSGLDVDSAIIRAWDYTGPPCTTAALTSAAGFLALSVAHFRGFSQLGLILSIGLVLCLVAMLVLLPPLIRWIDPNPPAPLRPLSLPDDSTSSYRLAPIGLAMVFTATILLGGVVVPKIQFEYDISALRRDGQAYGELTEQEQELMREAYSPVVVTVPDRRTLAKEHRRLEALVEAGKIPHIGRVLSIESVIPSDQNLRIEKLAVTAQHARSPSLRYLPLAIAKPLLSLRDWDAKPITEKDLPEGLPELLGLTSKRQRLLLMPQGNMWDMRESSQLIDELNGVVDNPTGEFLAQGSVYRTVMHDIPIIGVLAFLLITMLTAVDLRNITHAAGAVATLLAGMVWAMAAVSFAGLKISLVNIVGIPILLGIGVDVVIHLLHRLREEGPGGVRRAYMTTGVAATISTVTTVASFFSLTLAGNRGVRSLGLLVVLGLSAVFLASAVVLPLSWAAGWRITGRAPSDNSQD